MSECTPPKKNVILTEEEKKYEKIREYINSPQRMHLTEFAPFEGFEPVEGSSKDEHGRRRSARVANMETQNDECLSAKNIEV